MLRAGLLFFTHRIQKPIASLCFSGSDEEKNIIVQFVFRQSAGAY